MRTVTALGLGAVLLTGIALTGGCKKQEAEKAEAPATATAPATPSPAPATGPAPPGPVAPGEVVNRGEVLFRQHCAVCHPDGGNTVKPERTLRGKDLAARDITKPPDIVKIMRNPAPGMNRFDENTISDRDAMEIARYILVTFK